MKYIKGKWVKYSNKVFPKYVKEHWEVEISKMKCIGFNDFEKAIIYEKLIQLEREFTKEVVDG